MIIFALDSATAAGSAAIMRDGELLSEQVSDGAQPHSMALMPMCDEVFRQAGVSPHEIDGYAVTAGPGSFTGLRIGMGIIKGMAFGTGKPCAAVSTLEALAWGLRGSRRTVAAVLDARQGRVYTAGFAPGEDVRRLDADGVLYIGELAGRYAGQTVTFVGDAAELCYNELKDTLNCRLAPREFQCPRASCVARAAVERDQWRTAAALVPEYLQLPQAQRQRLNRFPPMAEESAIDVE